MAVTHEDARHGEDVLLIRCSAVKSLILSVYFICSLILRQLKLTSKIVCLHWSRCVSLGKRE